MAGNRRNLHRGIASCFASAPGEYLELELKLELVLGLGFRVEQQVALGQLYKWPR